MFELTKYTLPDPLFWGHWEGGMLSTHPSSTTLWSIGSSLALMNLFMDRQSQHLQAAEQRAERRTYIALPSLYSLRSVCLCNADYQDNEL